MAKLQYKALNKGIELETKIDEQLKEYDEKIINAMTTELAKLKAEYEELKVTANVRDVFDLDGYIAKQNRLRELPHLIDNLQRDRLKAINDKEQLQNDLCINVYKEFGADYQKEYFDNREILEKELDELAKKYNEIGNQIADMTTKYNDGLHTVIGTKGVYMGVSYLFKQID